MMGGCTRAERVYVVVSVGGNFSNVVLFTCHDDVWSEERVDPGFSVFAPHGRRYSWLYLSF